ncbi:MAG: VWA domain-containing protein, partial [Acidimicrobiales bacterium]
MPITSTIAYVDALGVVGIDRPDSVYWAGRATLVRRPEDAATYDECFAELFLGVDPDEPADDAPETLDIGLDDDGDAADDQGPADDGADPDMSLRWSRTEVLRHRDLARCTPDELREAWSLLARLRIGGSKRRARRLVPSRRRTDSLDLRRTARAAVRTGAEPVRRFHRDTSERTRRLVLIVDVSGSMEPYARALLRFANAALVGRGRVEVFTIGTRLTRVTRELASHDPDAALRRASVAVADLSGGTRLGDALGEFNERWGARGMARGADVVILSDGWDRGDPAVLGAAMERLHRVAHRVVWVNPLKASPGYEPLAQGMAAALPFVDRFVEGHSIASLEFLAEL